VSTEDASIWDSIERSASDTVACRQARSGIVLESLESEPPEAIYETQPPPTVRTIGGGSLFHPPT
jgi:hypothetical protein